MIKVDIDTANVEFERFCDSMYIESDVSLMDDDDKSSFNRSKSLIIRAIQHGNLIIDDDGQAVYTPFRPKSGYDQPITFNERTGSTLLSTDKRKKDQSVAKMYVALADMTGLDSKTFAKFSGPDIKVCEALFGLLMV